MVYVIMILSNYVIVSFVILNYVINEILKIQNSNSRLGLSINKGHRTYIKQFINHFPAKIEGFG